MIMGMTEKDATAFIERISATAIVNQAMLKCSLAGLELTPDNVVLLIGDFVDPTRPNFHTLIQQIENSVDEVFSVARPHSSNRVRALYRRN